MRSRRNFFFLLLCVIFIQNMASNNYLTLVTYDLNQHLLGQIKLLQFSNNEAMPQRILLQESGRTKSKVLDEKCGGVGKGGGGEGGCHHFGVTPFYDTKQKRKPEYR